MSYQSVRKYSLQSQMAARRARYPRRRPRPFRSTPSLPPSQYREDGAPDSSHGPGPLSSLSAGQSRSCWNCPTPQPRLPRPRGVKEGHPGNAAGQSTRYHRTFTCPSTTKPLQSCTHYQSRQAALHRQLCQAAPETAEKGRTGGVYVRRCGVNDSLAAETDCSILRRAAGRL